MFDEDQVERVEVVPDWQSRTERVYVIVRAGTHRGVLQADGDTVVSYSEASGEAPPPTFRLPEGVLDRILAQRTATTPPHAAVENHLSDAVGVRDRLLAMVERLSEPAVAPTYVVEDRCRA